MNFDGVLVRENAESERQRGNPSVQHTKPLSTVRKLPGYALCCCMALSKIHIE